MISQAATVDEFMKTLPPGEKAVFAQLRKYFKAAGPKVEESMKYRMPTYMVGENMVGALNKQKNYLCLYANPEAVQAHRKELGKLDCGKSCVRFRKPKDLPLAIAAKIIRAAAKLAVE